MPKAYSYIRMSTAGQLKGDSLRRQMSMSQEYADKHGLVLDTTFRLRDIGQSAFDGSNLTRGDLGEFLDAVLSGRVEKGSYLLVESLDRLSRQGALPALNLFMQLLSAGITVVTLADGSVFNSTSDFRDMSMSLAIMQRAHEESQTKSKRLSAAWQNKRSLISEKILTRRAVAWVRAREDASGFELIEERATVIRRMFYEAVELGMGADLIARRLNAQKVKPFGRANGWHKSYVLKILRNSACVGEFQPRDKKGLAAGPLLKGYYPSVVDQASFDQAQVLLASRRSGSAGRRGSGLTNLFMGLLRCGHCHGPMHLRNKGKKGGKVLICDHAHRELGCDKISWAYDEFEMSALTYLREVQLLAQRQTDSFLGACINRVSQARANVESLELKRERVFQLILGSEPTKFLQDQFRELDEGVAKAVEELSVAQTAADSALRTEAEPVDAAPLQELISKLQESGDFAERSAVAARIRRLVREIRLWPGGTPVSEDVVAGLRTAFPEKSAAELNGYLQLKPDRSKRAFVIVFKEGRYRVVSPSQEAHISRIEDFEMPVERYVM